MFDEFFGRQVRYKSGLKPWGSRSGNTIPAIIPFGYGVPYLRTKMPENSQVGPKMSSVTGQWRAS
jgi:hypothetical protein